MVGWELLLEDPAAPANLTGTEQQTHRDYELLTGGQELTVLLAWELVATKTSKADLKMSFTWK